MQIENKICQTDHRQIAAGMGVLIHVPDRVGINDDTDAGDQGHHDRAQAINIKADGNGKGAD